MQEKAQQFDNLELLTHDELRNQVELPRLGGQLEHVFQNSSFYQDKLRAEGIKTADACDPDRFTSLPFTEKAELLAEQEEHPPFGRLAVGDQKACLRRIHLTSGTTGRPYYIVLSERDVETTLTAGGRAFRCAGLGPEDTVVHCLNYCLWSGGVTDHLCLERTGATVVPFGVGNTKLLLQTIETIRPTAIHCTPSYMSRLQVVLSQEFGMRPRELGLRKGFFAGEGGLQNAAFRRQIEETWGIRAIDANYGMADVLSIFGSECEARQGLHFHGQGIIHIELIDPKSARVLPLEAGQIGELVLTHIDREVQPLVRFRTRDVIEVAGTDTCPCGRKSFRFFVVGRSDNMITIRGVNVFPAATRNLLSERPEWFGGEFQFVLDAPPPYERPLLRVELAESGDNSNTARLAQFIVDACRERLRFTPRVECVPFGTLPRTEGKTQWVRKTYD